MHLSFNIFQSTSSKILAVALLCLRFFPRTLKNLFAKMHNLLFKRYLENYSFQVDQGIYPA